jgi:tetratricopeptide (TPR) repeat protein
MVCRRISAVLVVASFALAARAQQPPQQPPAAAPPQAVTPQQAVERIRQALDEGLLERQPELAEQALDGLEEIIERDEANTQAHLLFGEILVRAGRTNPPPEYLTRYGGYDAARTHFRRVLDVEPQNFRANLGMGQIWNANRSYRQASSFLERAESVASDRMRIAKVKRELAMAYGGMGRLQEAVEKAKESVEANPSDYDALLTAVEIILTSASRNPRYVEDALEWSERLLELAKSQARDEPWERARIERLATALNLNLTALRQLHNSYYQRDLQNRPTDELQPGKEAEAAAALHRIAEKMRERAVLQTTLADHDAVLLAERAVAYDPRNLTYLETLAGLYQRLGNRPEAIAACQQILAVDADHERARQYLEAVGAPLEAPTEEPSDGDSPLSPLSGGTTGG